MNKEKPNEIDLECIFCVVEIHSIFLRELLIDVLSLIQKHVDFEKVGFDRIREGPTFSGEAGEVIEEDGESVK